MPYRFRAFGLTIASDVPIPGLVSTGDSGPADVRIDLAFDEDSWSHGLADLLCCELPADDTGCTLRVWRDAGDREFRLLFGDDSEFIIAGDGSRIRARWRDDVGIDGMSVYLLGPVLGFALRRHGATCLHAGAVSHGDGALAILAAAGRGKSTTAAAFGKRGVAVLTDDLLALREDGEAFWAQPAYPRIRLWPHAAEGLFGEADGLPRITPEDPGWDKRFIDLTEAPFRFCEHESALTALYVGVHDEAVQRPVLEAVNGRESILTATSHVYSYRLLGRGARARDFDRLARLLHSVPLRRFRMGAGFEHLEELCSLLLDDSRALARAGA